MTDKERLASVKFKKIKEYYSAMGGLDPDIQEDMRWLINRIEELELEVNNWRAEAQKWQQFYEESEESHFETIELLHSTSRVVKRYRQALEEISNADWNSEGLDAERELDKVTDLAIKALEGEG